MSKFDWRSLLRFCGGSILLIICGGILTVSPDSASVLISSVLGWLLIAAGVSLVIAGVIGGVVVITIIQGACILLAGVWLHRHPLMIASALGIILGLVALSQGFRVAMKARRAKRYGGFWIWDAGVAALELLVGLVLLLTPLSLSRFVVMLTGIFMVVCGVADLVAFWKGGSGPGGFDNIIDADY